MTKSEIAELKELAEKATPGPWQSKKKNGYAHEMRLDVAHYEHLILSCFARAHDYGLQAQTDAAFIAHANPAAVLSLIERLERLEITLVNVRSDLCWLMDRHELPGMINDTLTDVNMALDEGSKT